MDYDLPQVVVLFFSQSEMLALGQVLLLSDNRQIGAYSILQDAFLSSQVAAFNNAAALSIFNIFKGTVRRQILGRLSLNLRFTHNLADLLSVILFFALNGIL